jgi:hypothetical protein
VDADVNAKKEEPIMSQTAVIAKQKIFCQELTNKIWGL